MSSNEMTMESSLELINDEDNPYTNPTPNQGPILLFSRRRNDSI